MVYSKVFLPKMLSICLFLIAILSMMGSRVFVSDAVAQETITDKPELLVDSDWLEKHLDDLDKVRVISLEGKPSEFAEGHIPNSVYANWKTDIIDSANADLYALPSQAVVEAMLSRFGVTPKMTIVLADNLSNRVSTRLYWTLKTYGHPDVRILNGGVPAWKRAGKKMTTDTVQFSATRYKALKTKKETAADFADTDTVRKAVEKGAAIIDGRPVQQYSGEAPGVVYHTMKAHRRRGHIKSAISVPWKDNYNDDGTFKSIEELRKLYADVDVSPKQEAVTYCNEGLHAATTWFVLKELLGYPNVRLYDDSMSVWANRMDTPMETPNTPADR